jgi:hypothetical protein
MPTYVPIILKSQLTFYTKLLTLCNPHFQIDVLNEEDGCITNMTKDLKELKGSSILTPLMESYILYIS